jgi:PKD repeat protein
MQTIITINSKWRWVTAIVLVAASGLFLSETFGKTKTLRPASKSGGPTQPAAATPPSGTLDPANPSITYTDGPTDPNPTGVLGAPDCSAPNSCSDFMVTINASSLAATHNVTWVVQWVPPNVDLDIFVEDAAGNLVANNNSTVDPSAIILPIPADGTVYHLIVAASVGTAPINGSVTLTKKFPAAQQGQGAPPRYINYPAASGQANGSNEPSMGVDWNPNDPSLVNISGQTRKNTGGVAFFTGDTIQWRNDFDDCSSPAMNVWTDSGAPIITGLDPIGFVDHFSTAQLGLGPNPPQTPGRVFGLDLAAGTSTAAISDDDGATWTPLVAGNYPAGPDHETLGGGPFHAPLSTPPAPAYPNAIYYCSQNGVQNAECSRSDDGGLTYGPGVPIFDPTVCGGGIHGHVKVSPQGTVYVPNSSCGAGDPVGADGVAVSTDNGITWTEQNVPASTGSQDPAIGIGQNNVGKPAGQISNTIYFGWVSGDGHAHIAHSPDEGATWQDDTDISSIIGSQNSVFPIVVAGDDNRAAYGFLGTDPDFPNKQVWHLYVATTYDGGHSWLLVDATPDDPVQIGNVCLLGIGCSGARNLLDFNGIDVDKEGRVLIGYTDGCVNCSNTENISQSSNAHGTIARQSGGRRLFAAFDPVEPAPPPAPQVLSAVRVTSPATGVLVSWLKPDNGGSPLTGYNVYRGTASGNETFLAHVSGADTTKYLDQTADPVNNSYYRVMAVNGIGESTYCHELSVNAVQPSETACQLPYVSVQTDPDGDQVGGPNANTQLDIERVGIGEPFVSCTDKSVTFLLKVNNLNPTPIPNGGWRVLFNARDTNGVTRQLFVEMETETAPTPTFNYGYKDPSSGSTSQCFLSPTLTSCPVSGSYSADGTIIMKLDVSQPLEFFSATNTTGVPDFVVNIPTGTDFSAITADTSLLIGAVGTGELEQIDITAGDGVYTTVGNLSCSAGEPVAGLVATPMSGPPSLNVNFDASSSNDTSLCATITSYTLDFGDGSAPVTQSSPFFSHTYNNEGDYAARLAVTDSAGQTSNTTQVVISVQAAVPQLTGVVSRKTHGSAGAFDLNLPLSGSPAIECRSGGANGDYTLIFVFSNTLTSVGNIDVTGTGSVSSSSIGTDAHQYTVNLTGVANAQDITVTLTNVQDSAGNAGDVSASMGVLVGDTNGDGFVNSADISQTKSQSGNSVTASNFREDVNTDGFLNSADISLVKSKSGTALP